MKTRTRPLERHILVLGGFRRRRYMQRGPTSAPSDSNLPPLPGLRISRSFWYKYHTQAPHPLSFEFVRHRELIYHDQPIQSVPCNCLIHHGFLPTLVTAVFLIGHYSFASVVLAVKTFFLPILADNKLDLMKRDDCSALYKRYT